MGYRAIKRIIVSQALLAALLVLSFIHSTPAEGVRKRIKFAKGSTSTVVRNAVIRGDVDEYLLGAREGQHMTVKISSVEANAAFHIYKPGRSETLAGAGEEDDATEWSGELPATGDYVIVVGPTRGNATYRLRVEIR